LIVVEVVVSLYGAGGVLIVVEVVVSLYGAGGVLVVFTLEEVLEVVYCGGGGGAP
jgi:hypothetical protein